MGGIEVQRGLASAESEWEREPELAIKRPLNRPTSTDTRGISRIVSLPSTWPLVPEGRSFPLARRHVTCSMFASLWCGAWEAIEARKELALQLSQLLGGGAPKHRRPTKPAELAPGAHTYTPCEAGWACFLAGTILRCAFGDYTLLISYVYSVSACFTGLYFLSTLWWCPLCGDRCRVVRIGVRSRRPTHSPHLVCAS